ncbi:MAG TPA: GAF domain-containing SpoIIE family protein phosphatase [Acidimicrobiales bacterium]|nr:GAF domain-containing SpoIIE family protein phosphatase [Acidimicrobiales bacterium]
MSKGTEYAGLIRAVKRADPADVADVMVSAAAELGGADVVVYLVDFEQQVLEPLPDHSTHDELPHSEEVGTTIAGRAFIQRRATTAQRPDGTRVWVPIIEGSDPTGVLALTIPEADEAALATCEDLGLLAGYLIAAQARVTDLYNLHRRRRAMSLAASMQWDLLPPLTLASRRVVAAGMLEPAYEIGGDCFDYALNGTYLDVAIMDSMGHGLSSAMVAALAMGCYRHDRREGRNLEHIHRNLDAIIAHECDGEAFVTGLIGRLDLNTGDLTWINAGHPPPMLVRHGQVIGPLDGPPAFPWALGPSDVEVNTTALEPGDSVLFYTDGVIEARGGRREDFGAARLADVIGQHASDQLSIGLIVRLVIRAVREHHGGRLHDDATVLMIHWPGPVNGLDPAANGMSI